MVSRTSSKSIDVQQLVRGVAKLELKLLNAGVEAMQVYLNQAGRLSILAGDTLEAIQEDKVTLVDTAHKLIDFGRQNVKAYADLSQRLGVMYYDEFERLAGSAIRSEKIAAAEGSEVASAVQMVAKSARRTKRKHSPA